jgi:CDP-glucose 4,6-dehydratase
MATGGANLWQDRRVLVTGATGFVGSYLTSRLLDVGANVTVIMRDLRPDSCFINDDTHMECNIVKGDLLDYRLIERTLAEYEIDSVFHLAAQTVVSIANTSPYPTIDNNIRSTLNVLEAMRVYGKVRHAVIASSDKAYGELFHRRKYVEKDAVQGVHPYDVSKSCCDLLAQTYIMTYELPIAITRCGNIYGGGDMNWSRLIPNTIRRILKGQLPVIHGSGSETRDYFYVEDCVQAYMLLSERTAVGPYNFSTGEEMTVKKVIETLCKVMDVPVQYDTLCNANAEIYYQWLDSTKARTNLGWLPKYSFAEGLRKTVDWYRNRLAKNYAK